MTEEKQETFTLTVGKKVRFGPLAVKLTDIIPSWKPAPAPTFRQTTYIATVLITSGRKTKELTMDEGVSNEAFGYLFTFDRVTEKALTLTIGPNGSRLPPPEWETVGPIRLNESATYQDLTITLVDIKEVWLAVEGGRLEEFAADVDVASGAEKASLRLSPGSDDHAFGYDFHVLAIDFDSVTLGLKRE